MIYPMLDALRITEVEIPTTWPCSSNTGCKQLKYKKMHFESFSEYAKQDVKEFKGTNLPHHYSQG